jgi:hypothetical protein
MTERRIPDAIITIGNNHPLRMSIGRTSRNAAVDWSVGERVYACCKT